LILWPTFPTCFSGRPQVKMFSQGHRQSENAMY
jgi:hypothetical protein